jgi:hypothetical protein
MIKLKTKEGSSILKAESIGFLETYCKAYNGNKRDPKKDGFYKNSELKVIN